MNMSKQAPDSQSNPAFKEPWFWMVMGPLIVVVIAGIATIILALKYSDDVVSDGYVKEGKAYKMDNHAYELAKLLDVSGKLFIESDGRSAQLQLASGKSDLSGKKVSVLFSHPVDENQDLVFDVNILPDGTVPLAFASPISGRWMLHITSEPTPKSWKLKLDAKLEAGKTYSIMNDVRVK